MILSRQILKSILRFLAKLAIRKHNIKFVVVVGWFGTEVVREGIYQFLSDRYVLRRNTTRVWWDFSIPLTILGYEDKKRNVFEWIGLICRSIGALIFNKKNQHRIVLDLNLANEDTSKYWKNIIKPEILIVTSYHSEHPYLVNDLVEATKNNGGKVFLTPDLDESIHPGLARYGTLVQNHKFVSTTNNKYPINPGFSRMFVKLYCPIISVAEQYDFLENEILDALARFDGINIVTKRIRSNITSF